MLNNINDFSGVSTKYFHWGNECFYYSKNLFTFPDDFALKKVWLEEFLELEVNYETIYKGVLRFWYQFWYRFLLYHKRFTKITKKSQQNCKIAGFRLQLLIHCLGVMDV